MVRGSERWSCLGKSVALFTDKVETEDKTERDADAIKRELQSQARQAAWISSIALSTMCWGIR